MRKGIDMSAITVFCLGVMAGATLVMIGVVLLNDWSNRK